MSRFHIYDKTSCAAARGHISAPIAPLGLQWQMRADVYEAERHSEHRRTTRGIEDFVWYSPRVSPVSGMSVQDHNVLPNVSSPTRTIRPLRSNDQSVFAYANTDRIEKEGTPVVKPSPSAVVFGVGVPPSTLCEGGMGKIHSDGPVRVRRADPTRS